MLRTDALTAEASLVDQCLAEARYVTLEPLQVYWQWARCRLPTEAEWEYACRAGTTTRFCFGDKGTGLSDYAWFGKNSGGRTHPVGQKQPNRWGLHDIHGNVWEWCQDWFAEDYYGRAPWDNPPGHERGELRVLRGGCCRNPGEDCRSAFRRYSHPSRRRQSVEFRVVLVPRSVS